MASRQVKYNTVEKDERSYSSKLIYSVMTQACHAATAILHITCEDENTKEYLSDLDNMHKVVLEVRKTAGCHHNDFTEF